MQMLVDGACHRAADAADLLQIADARAQHALQSAEVREQAASAHRPKAGNGLEYRFAVTPGAPPSMSRDRKAMRLVAHPLDEVQRGTVRLEADWHLLAGQMQAFLSGPPVRALGDADDRDIAQPGLRERTHGGIHLSR